MKRNRILTAAMLVLFLTACCTVFACTAKARPIPVWKFCHGLCDGLDTAVITAFTTDCETGTQPALFTPEEEAWIRRVAINGVITDKANDTSVTGGTWIWSFETPDGKHLLSIEMYRGLIVGSDGMYHYQ